MTEEQTLLLMAAILLSGTIRRGSHDLEELGTACLSATPDDLVNALADALAVAQTLADYHRNTPPYNSPASP